MADLLQKSHFLDIKFEKARFPGGLLFINFYYNRLCQKKQVVLELSYYDSNI